MRALAAALAALAVVAAPAPAAVRLAAGTGEVQALTVTPSGEALAVVDSPDPARPFALVRSSGAGRSAMGTFGTPGVEFPDVASGEGGTFVTWQRPVSGGGECSVAPAADLRDATRFTFATGPCRLTVSDGAPLLAFPDRSGDAAIVRGGATTTLTSSAPERRHLAMDAAAGPKGPLVLDLVQRRDRTELHVLGAGAPEGAVVSIGALRHLPATLAAGKDVVAVAFLSRGHAFLATARPGATWRRRALPGEGRGAGSPGVAVTPDGVVTVAYAQIVGRQREILTYTLEADGSVTADQLTTHPADDRDPFAAAGPGGELYVAWTRRVRRPAQRIPMLERLG